MLNVHLSMLNSRHSLLDELSTSIEEITAMESSTLGSRTSMIVESNGSDRQAGQSEYYELHCGGRQGLASSSRQLLKS